MRWRRISGFARSHWVPLMAVVLLTLAIGVTGAFEPLLLKVVLDELDGPRRMDAIVGAVGAFAVLLVGREIVAAFTNWLSWRTRLDIHFELLSATVDRLHALPLTYHQEAGVGATMLKLDRGVQSAVAGLAEIVFNVLPSLVYLFVAITVMIRLDWRAALVSLVFVPAPALIGFMSSPEQVQRERQLLDRWTAIYARFNEVLAGIVTVKSFAMEDEEKRRFLTRTREANSVVVAGVARDSLVQAVQGGIVVTARLAALIACAMLVMRGTMGVGTVVAFLGYVAGMFAPLRTLVGSLQTWRKTSVALDTVIAILDAQNSLGDAPDALNLTNVRGAVSFEQVSFNYDGRGPSVDGVSFEVRPGEVVAIVGPSGAGKTTLMALLLRLYDPNSGVIRIDGHDLRTLQQRSIRRNIGVVLQDALLFNDSVRSNVLYGKPDASDEELYLAMRAAHVLEFTQKLPDDIETIVGERGSKLSAGQRQRVTIARALLKNPPILVLDEATSALDAESEALVNDALAQLASGRTVFNIVHRLHNAARADRIFVMHHGRLVEHGAHDELIRLGGVYARMFALQVRP